MAGKHASFLYFEILFSVCFVCLILSACAVHTVAFPVAAELASDWYLSTAFASENVVRSSRPGRQTAATVELAQEERESIQIVVVSPSQQLSISLQVAPETSRRTQHNDTPSIPELSLATVGFVHRGPCPYDSDPSHPCPPDHPIYCRNSSTCSSYVVPGHKAICSNCTGCSTFGPNMGNASWANETWFPYAVLPAEPANSSELQFDVASGSVQPVLVTFHASAGTAVGRHAFKVTVTDIISGESQFVTLTVDVFNFTLPLSQNFLTMWGVNEQNGDAVYGAGGYNTTALSDLLLEHRLPVSSLYSGVEGLPSVRKAGPDALKALWQRGQRVWNVAHHIGDVSEFAPGAIQQYIDEVSFQLANFTDVAGWPHENLMVYMFDEPGFSKMPALENISRALKGTFPKLQIVTCGDTQWHYFMEDPDRHLQYIDVFVPRAATYSADWLTPQGTDALRRARGAGKRVGWYFSGLPAGGWALNFFTEVPFIRSRLLSGLAAVKQGSDALLYYRLDGWTPAYSGMGGVRSISKTQELLDFKYGAAAADGEGLLLLPGDGGRPLATLPLVNVRDGLEDLAYYRLLDTYVLDARGRGIDVKQEEALLVVPDAVFAMVQPTGGPHNATFTQDSNKLQEQRHTVAQAILSVKGKLAIADVLDRE